MRVRFEMTKPDDMEATMTITMTVKRWKELRAELPDKWPAWDLGRAIGDVVRQAEESFYPGKDGES